MFVSTQRIEDVKEVFASSYASLQHARARQEGLSLEDCVQSFLAPEQLAEDNMWYCPKCKAQKPAFKKFDIWKTPKILIVHLKRSLSRD